jgi:hypothetical protein
LDGAPMAGRAGAAAASLGRLPEQG